MKVYEDMVQGSDEWLEIRKGIFTASEMGKWITAEKRGVVQQKAAFKAICNNLAEMSGCEAKPLWPDWYMERGTRLEPEARESYQIESGYEVEQVGFCLHDNGQFGCSPDGFVENRKGMIQIKCPAGFTHAKYMLEDDSFLDDHKIQLHMEMAVTGAKFNEFYSYCPGLPSVLIRVERDAYTEDLLRGLIRLSAEFKEYKAIMSQKWKAMKTRIESEK